jgi:hypothetical protein
MRWLWFLVSLIDSIDTLLKVSSQLHVQGTWPLRKGPFEYEAGWAPELVWMFWKRVHSSVPARSQTLGLAAHSLGTKQLCYNGCWIKKKSGIKGGSFLEWVGGRLSLSAWPHCSQQQNQVKMLIYCTLQYILTYLLHWAESFLRS